VASVAQGAEPVSDASWAGVGAAIGAIFTGVFAWATQRMKGGTDIEVAVLAEWQKLNGALSKRLSAVEAEFATYRTKVAKEIDEMRAKHRAEMRAMRELNDGLQRQIAQHSQSTANLLSDSPVTRPKDDGDDG
jgi:nucleosome binding factor SPN SPT16 subunit